MAGGIFKASQPKIRPGVYVNLKNGIARTPVGTGRGVGIIPLIGYDWGPREQFIKISAESPDANFAKFGRSIYDDNSHMLMLMLMLMGCETVHVWICDAGAKAAKTIALSEAETPPSVTATAKYKGSLGNKLQVVSVANPTSGFDVSIYLDGAEVERFESLATIADIIAVESEYIDFTSSSTTTTALVAFAGQTLTGGTDTSSGNTSITNFLDKSEKIKFNCMAFPETASSLLTALKTKIKYIRETLGWKCQAVAPDFEANYEGIINLVNSFAIDDTQLTTAQATAWLAGATAGAEYNESLTHAQVDGATTVVNELTNEAAEAAIKAGKSFFTVDEDGGVILEYDINSLTTFTGDTPLNLNKNRPLRVYDSFCNDCLLNFVPGQIDNEKDGWLAVEGEGKVMLRSYEEDHAITNVDLDNDFKVDREQSYGDSMYINVGLQAVDSADKYYITVTAR